jgi:hypothetical protein
MNISDIKKKTILAVIGWVVLLLGFACRVLTFDFWNGYIHLLIMGTGTIYWLFSLAFKKRIKNFLIHIRQVKHYQNDKNNENVTRLKQIFPSHL